MKKQDLLTVTAIVAGALLLRKKGAVSGIGRITMPREELNAYLNKIVKPCHEMRTAWWAGLNKNNTIAEYLEQWDLRGEPLDTYWNGYMWEELQRGEWKDAQCVRQLDFNMQSMREYQALCNMLLSDFDVFKSMGGDQTNDPSLEAWMKKNPDKPWYNAPREILDNVKWYCANCILVTFNGVPQYIVDPQGYNYARYVGICATFNTIV